MTADKPFSCPTRARRNHLRAATRPPASQAQRAAKATFDHFGLLTVRTGGKYVTVYLDDLTYTSRRSKDAPRTHHEQKLTVVPYPANGRKY